MWAAAASSSSSTSSSSTVINTAAATAALLPKTMEEVWKDISLASDLPHTSAGADVILQDFFSPKHPSPAAVSASSPQPPPPTLLTLSSGPNFGSLLLPSPHSHPIPNLPALNVPSFDALIPDDDHAGATISMGKRRFIDCDRNSGDRRHKRMIKNRESAARSRARKQAYTNELELEVAHLLEENARLREQQQQLYSAAAAQTEKRKPLHRTSTAPF